MLLCSKALKRSSDTASAFAFLLQLLTARRCQNVKEVKTRLRVQLPSSADKAPLLAVAADQYLLPAGPQQQTCHSGVRRPNDGTDGRTDRLRNGQTDGRPAIS